MEKRPLGLARSYALLRQLLLGQVPVFGLVFIILASAPVCFCQEGASDAELRDELKLQVEHLNASSFRVRERAVWKLGMYPEQSLPILIDALDNADHHSGAEIVDLLTEIALEEELEYSIEAMEALEATAKKLTSIGRLAQNSLYSIADLQEAKAIEILIHHDAVIGRRTFSLNGVIDQGGGEDALHINEQFTGDDECIQRIPFLKSVRTVCLEGPKIDRRHLEAICKMQGVENVKLKSINLKSEDLKLLQQFNNLQHLGLLYVDIGDEAVEILQHLPVSDSMKIYGTRMSQEGFERLQARLDGLRFYFGKGGFLGVSPVFLSGTQVGRVTPGSAAEVAGIEPMDILKSVNSIPVNTFADLREELGKYEAGETIKIKVVRSFSEFDVDVVLQEE